MSFSNLLYKKYNVAGPRYTSYPTVPYWDRNPTTEEWMQSIADALKQAKTEDVGAALYVHIPFCKSLCTYCGCNTRISQKTAVGGPYVSTLLKEWSLYRERLGQIDLTEMHLGGGTPTFLPPDELKRLISGLLENSKIHADHEFSLEADPRVTSHEQLKVLFDLGFRRLSLGIQDFDPKVQDIVNRIQTPDQVKKITDMAREIGYTSVNYDLIYGLPLQTIESVTGTIEAVRVHRPDRIAFYGYAHVPWIKPSHRRFTEADLPSGDEKRRLYETGRQLLEEVGYQEVGMDHFTLKTDPLWVAAQNGALHRNFMGYTSRQVSPLIGLGVSAIGDSWTAFAQNEKLLENYQSRVEKGELPIQRGHLLNPEDLIIRRHVLNLMTRMGTRWDSPELYTEYLEQVPERLAELERDGLIVLNGKQLQVKEEGRAFLRNICMAFDARLTRQAPTTQLFSKTM